MYKDYYRLAQEPFNLTPDPRFLYLTAQHAEALNHMLYGIHMRKGFICITGEVGTGKTTLCRALLEQLPETVQTALILNPLLDTTQLLRAIISELRIDAPPTDALEHMRLLNEWLLQADARGHNAALIIDEAQDMPDETLELTRLLSNLETHSRKLLQIVLLGQPELRAKLSQANLRQLDQRITVRYHLQPMSRDDVDKYIRYRIATAGAAQMYQRPIHFERAAIKAIYRYSRGTPRLVNAVSDKALLAGYVHGTGQIDRRLVRMAVRDLKGAA